jgi:hypothetical protein
LALVLLLCFCNSKNPQSPEAPKFQDQIIGTWENTSLKITAIYEKDKFHQFQLTDCDSILYDPDINGNWVVSNDTLYGNSVSIAPTGYDCINGKAIALGWDTTYTQNYPALLGMKIGKDILIKNNDSLILNSGSVSLILVRKQ